MGSYASEHRTFFYNLKRYGFTLSKDEIKQIVISVLLIAFIWSFNKWGSTTFNFMEGIKNFILGALFAFIGIIFNQVGQRLVAVHYGYDPVYEYGMMGLMMGMIVTFASRGLLIFFLPGAINIRHLAASRLGEFRYYTNDWEWAKAGFMGPFLNIFLATILAFFKQNLIVQQLIWMNVFFAWYSLIPLPGNLGLYLFYPHIYFWSFTVGFVLASTVLLFLVMKLAFSPILILIFALLFGAFAMFWHYQKDGKWSA
jgi:hypothetical protein